MAGFHENRALAVIIPTLNEGRRIAALLEDLQRAHPDHVLVAARLAMAAASVSRAARRAALPITWTGTRSLRTCLRGFAASGAEHDLHPRFAQGPRSLAGLDAFRFID